MKPILFNTEMVRAIPDDRKTVTRRAVKPQPPKELQYPYGFISSSSDKNEVGKYCWTAGEICDGRVHTVRPPYRPGDILYVRETWAEVTDLFGEFPQPIYKADIKDNRDYDLLGEVKWRPSIHMPREAARIFLRVTDVRVERLQDITEEQAIKEGVPDDWPMDKVYCPICKGEGLIGAVHPVSLGFMEVECPHCEKGTSRFQNLWNSTIKPADLPLYGWDASPWIWVIEFERCEKP